MWPPNNEDNYFTNMDYSKNVINIMPSAEIMVHFTADMMRSKKACLLYAERMDFKEVMQLRLVEKCDQRRMYITTVDTGSFQQLKQDQSLNVSFGGFMDNVVRMLKDCQIGKLDLHLTSRDALTSDSIAGQAENFYLQFVEVRSFKNLVHLCLPCRSASLHTVLFYINLMLDTAYKKSYLLEQNAQQMQMELSSQRAHLDQLGTDNSKLREALAENNRILAEKHASELQQIQDKLVKLNEQRGHDQDRHCRTIANLQAQLDRVQLDKSDLKTLQEQSEKRIQTLNEEINCFKSKISTLKEQNDKLLLDINTAKKHERKLDYKIEDLKQHTSELQEQIQKDNKEKANMSAELEAERKILHTKRQALEMASMEIAKANQIIVKQNQELLIQKKTIAWRTEVALQQEKAIREKEKLLALREEEVKQGRQTIQQLREEIPQQLESMRHFAQGLEQKYSNQILTLKHRLSSGKENRK